MFHKTPSGFMLDFPNGWTASVQFGPGNYCSNRDMKHNPFSDPVQFIESETAEIAAWRTETRGEGISLYRATWYTFEDGQDVKGWQNITHVMEFLNMVAGLPDTWDIMFPNQVSDLPLTPADVQTASNKWKPILKDWGIDY